jgi:long-chain fatty acid transport protein
MMRNAMGAASNFRRFLLGACAMSAVAIVATDAQAGGFASRQQSTTGQGFSFAGAGTSAFGIGSMFWNPANITNFQGRRSEWNFTLVAPEFSVTADRLTSGTGGLNLFGPPTNIGQIGSGNINQGTLTTASYNSLQVNNWLWLGLQTGTPFGSRTKADQGFSGAVFGTSTIVRAIAITPTIGIKLSDWLSIGFGVTAQQLNVTLNGGDPRFAPLLGFPGGAALLPAASLSRIKGDAYGFGFTAGVTLKPFDGTEISLGYRSSIRHSLEGEFDFTAPLATANPAVASRLVRANINLPEIATLGVSQRINQDWTITGTVQWTNWSRLNTVPVTNRISGAPITGLGFRYRDEWFFAAGAQYRVNQDWTVRAGLAYEISPVTDENRGVRVLDSDRIWASFGLGYKWSEKLEFDAAYSRVFTKSGRVDIVPAGSPFNPVGNPSFNGAAQFNGSSKGHIDIFALSVKYRWDDPAPAPVRPVVTKF